MYRENEHQGCVWGFFFLAVALIMLGIVVLGMYVLVLIACTL